MDYPTREERTGLLGFKDEAGSSTSSISLRDDYDPTPKKRTHFVLLSVLLNILLVLSNFGSLAVIFGFRRELCKHGPDLIYSPAQGAVSYEARFMNNSLEEKSPFKGLEPNNEQTEAWKELLKWQVLTLTEDDMKSLDRLNNNSVKLEDGSGYLGQLDLYHELHCLNYIREYVHRDYYDNELEGPLTAAVHVDHCFETLRQIIMCHADTSIVTYDWVEGHETPLPNFAIVRECRNWDQMFDFVKSRQPTMYPGMIVNPEFGKAVNVSHHHHSRNTASPRFF